jgi:hypothetical protein
MRIPKILLTVLFPLLGAGGLGAARWLARRSSARTAGRTSRDYRQPTAFERGGARMVTRGALLGLATLLSAGCAGFVPSVPGEPAVQIVVPRVAVDAPFKNIVVNRVDPGSGPISRSTPPGDNVAIKTPEPALTVLVLLGAGGLSVARWLARRRR